MQTKKNRVNNKMKIKPELRNFNSFKGFLGKNKINDFGTLFFHVVNITLKSVCLQVHELLDSLIYLYFANN